LFNQRLLNERRVMTHSTPAQVLERRRELLLNQDYDGFADLFAPEAVIETPFAGPGMLSRQEGQDAIRDFARRVAASPLHFSELETVALHHTGDPEVVIEEHVAKGTLGTTGRTFAAAAIGVFRIRDGKILSFRNYADPRGLSEVLGD
jgi:uncharacterized protein